MGEIKYYVAFERDTKKLVCIQDHEMNTPDDIDSFTITQEEYSGLSSGYLKLDIDEKRTVNKTEEELLEVSIYEEIIKARFTLNSTDWKVLRHVREKNLNKETTLSEDEYLALETLRESAAEFIRKNQ